MLKSIFTWWNGATIGTRFTLFRGAKKVGEDEFGNRYYEAKTDRNSYDKGRRRRYVTYKGLAEPSLIPPEWHGWMHYIYDTPPSEAPMALRSWELPHKPNLTGTPNAYRPAGSIAGHGQRAQATGDYEAWTPE
ncbi:MAG: NADH:ubiquinone oxidoreductase subunit NDUFA12 [Caulobacteraceae bacterium]